MAAMVEDVVPSASPGGRERRAAARSAAGARDVELVPVMGSPPSPVPRARAAQDVGEEASQCRRLAPLPLRAVARLIRSVRKPRGATPRRG